MFEVRSEREDDGDNGFYLETRRTERKAAEEDVEILKFLGKRAWIVEVS